MAIKLIVARGENNVIGNEGKLPWKLKTELEIFKNKTEGNIVVMGRNTFDSIKKPLPNRINVVLSRSRKGEEDGVLYTNSLDDIINLSNKLEKDVWIIGGLQIYNLFFDLVDEHHVTTVYGNFQGDVYYDKDYSDFIDVECQEYKDFKINVYRKNKINKR